MNWTGWIVGLIAVAGLGGWMWMKDDAHRKEVARLEYVAKESRVYADDQAKAIAQLEIDKALLAGVVQAQLAADEVAKQAEVANQAILGSIRQLKAAIAERVKNDPASDVSVHSDSVDWLRDGAAQEGRGGNAAGGGEDHTDPAGPTLLP